MSGIFDLRGYIGNLRLANMGQRQGDRNEIGRCPAALFGPYASWNVRFAPKAVPRHSHPWRKQIVFSGRA